MTNIKKVQIPDLGEVQGVHDAQTGITRFLGIPYGVIPKRWVRAEAVTSFPNGIHDGTKPGPMCPQVYQEGAPSIFQLAVPGFPPISAVSMDELGCLNLIITKPETTSGPLPVMVWIHGGGFAVGSNSELVYDGVDLIQTSVKSGNPIIHVAINYRVGFFGFLASEELKNDNIAKAPGNYGLWDQRLALEFIKRNISNFGGDPNRITIFGESAGGASVHAHLLAGQDLFQQAISQSGVLRTIGPVKVSDAYAEHRYRSLFELLPPDGAQSLESLRAVQAEKLVELTVKQYGHALGGCFITDDTDCEDGFFPKNTDWITVQPFCKRLMIGDCATEGMIMAPVMALLAPADAIKVLSSTPTLPSSVLSQFGLSSSKLDKLNHHDQAGMKLLTDLQNELAFHGQIEAVIAAAPADSTYIYRLDRPNSWPGGPFAGIAHHTIDLLYLGGVPLRFPTAEAGKDRKISEAMLTHWTDFAAGKAPWRSAGTERWEMLYGSGGEIGEVKRAPGEARGLKMVGKAYFENADAVHHINTALSSGFVL